MRQYIFNIIFGAVNQASKALKEYLFNSLFPTDLHRKFKKFHFSRKTHIIIRVSIVVSIPACHAGDRGSIPRHGDFFFKSLFPFFLTYRAQI